MPPTLVAVRIYSPCESRLVQSVPPLPCPAHCGRRPSTVASCHSTVITSTLGGRVDSFNRRRPIGASGCVADLSAGGLVERGLNQGPYREWWLVEFVCLAVDRKCERDYDRGKLTKKICEFHGGLNGCKQRVKGQNATRLFCDYPQTARNGEVQSLGL